MLITKYLGVISIAAFFGAGLLQLQGPSPAFAQAAAATPNVAVEPQYDRTHIYVAPEDFDRFVASVVATFGVFAGKPTCMCGFRLTMKFSTPASS
jgi:hypothetical protein